MTVRAISGLVVLNLFLLGVGSCVLFAMRGWRSWTELGRLSGVAYLLGVSAFFVVLTMELVVGIPFRFATVLLTGLGLGLAGIAVGRRRKHEVPRSRSLGWSPGRPSLLGALLVGGIVVYFEALFRAGRLSPLGWDVWASWVPKAKGIFYAGELDPELFGSLAGPSYPPGLPALHAVAFHAMGSADAVTLHLQYWFLGVGFVGAVAGLLASKVRPAMLLPLLLLMLVMPDVRNRATDLYGDVPLGYLVAAGALLVLLWIQDSKSWKLMAATALLGGAMLTKREGLLFAACIIVAALVASFHERRSAWPRIAAAGLVAFALALPWRVWFTANGLPGDAPEGGYLGLADHLDRAWPSLRLVLETFFDYDLWLVLPTLAVAAAVLAFLAGARREALFALTFLGTALIGSAWTIWSNPSVGIGVEEGLVNRVVGTPALVLAALMPLLLEKAWRGRSRVEPVSPASRAGSARLPRAVLAGSIVVAALAVYPAMTLAGGGPIFPSVEDCVGAPVEGEKVRVVFGYESTFPEAHALRDRAVEVGFTGTEAAQDGCGRVRVFVDDVPSLAIGEEIVREARTVDLAPTLELDPDD